MKRMKPSVLSIFVVLLFMVPIAQAAPPALDPACEGLTGVAFGLCMAATAGARCNSEEPSATSNACERLASQYRDETGEEPPWIPSCYSFTAEEVSNASSNFRDYGCCGGVGVHSVTGEPCAFITCEGYDEVNLVFVGYGVKTFGGVHEECNYSETSITGLCKITKYPFSLPSDWTYDDPGASPTYFFSPSNLPLADYMACADILKGSW